jgi:tetratricopeptide (TPR) repeat protein
MSDEPKASMDLDPEMLAAYIDNRLSPEQRAAVEAELARDPDAYAVLVASLKALDEVPELHALPQVPVPQAPQRRWTIAASVLAAAAAILLVVRLQTGLLPWSQDHVATDPLIARVIEAASDDRYVEARLTGFKYGPLKSITRGDATPGTRTIVLRALIDQLRNDQTAAGGHALGLALLQVGDYDGAIAELRRVSELGSRVQSDLAAALIARGKAYDRPGDFSEAVAVATRAVQADPALLEARFNRALAQQMLGSPEAPLAWNDYLAHDTDSTSPWAAEARAHLAAR